VIFLWLPSSGPSRQDFDHWVQARDVATLARYVDVPKGNTQFLDAIKTGGPYEGGRFGWHAVETDGPGESGRFIVFTTPLTSEDIGEYVFERRGSRLKLLPEDDALGAEILRHEFDIRFNVPSKRVDIKDRLSLDVSPSPEPVVIRLGSEFKVSAVLNASGTPVPFSQAGGTIFVARRPGKSDLTIQYGGQPNRPAYS